MPHCIATTSPSHAIRGTLGSFDRLEAPRQRPVSQIRRRFPEQDRQAAANDSIGRVMPAELDRADVDGDGIGQADPAPNAAALPSHAGDDDGHATCRLGIAEMPEIAPTSRV